MSVYTEAFLKDKLIKELEAEHCEVIKVSNYITQINLIQGKHFKYTVTLIEKLNKIISCVS